MVVVVSPASRGSAQQDLGSEEARNDSLFSRIHQITTSKEKFQRLMILR
jgi:hypothetical protein